MGIAETHEQDLSTHTFETFVSNMKPYLDRIVTSRERKHAYLGRDDMVQEGLTEMWLIWNKFSTTLPMLDMCKIASEHIRLRLITCYQKSQSRKEGTAKFLHLDSPVNAVDGAAFHDIISLDDSSPEARLLAREEIEDALELMGEKDQDVMAQLLSPSDTTLDHITDILETSNPRRTLVSERNQAIALSLGLPATATTRSWRNLQEVFGSPAERYTHQTVLLAWMLIASTTEEKMPDPNAPLVEDALEDLPELDGVTEVAPPPPPAPVAAPKPTPVPVKAEKPAPAPKPVPAPKVTTPKVVAPKPEPAKAEPQNAGGTAPQQVLFRDRAKSDYVLVGTFVKEHTVTEVFYEVQVHGQSFLVPKSAVLNP